MSAYTVDKRKKINVEKLSANEKEQSIDNCTKVLTTSLTLASGRKKGYKAPVRTERREVRVRAVSIPRISRVNVNPIQAFPSY